jgi:hypothetical protein
MAPFCPYCGCYVQSCDGGEKEMADACILGPIASTEMAMKDGKELRWQRYTTLPTTAQEGA